MDDAGARFAAHPAVEAVAGVLLDRGLDRAQADAVLRAAHRKARPRGARPDSRAWRALLDRHADAAPAPHRDRFLACRSLPVPDPRSFTALSDADDRAAKAAKALRRQVAFAAAAQGVGERAAAGALARLRASWRPGLAAPSCWAAGFTGRDVMAMSCPDDPATLWALHRLQTDPGLFAGTRRLGYASVDLETAGPSGKDGFLPANGCVIEVGVVLYDWDGTETGRTGGLVAADPAVLARCGTGAVDVHGISPQMLVGAPGWDRVAPHVSAALKGRTMLSHNVRYENAWLEHHLGLLRVPFDRWAPQMDTVCWAKQHAEPLGDYRLATVCGAAGVPYTDGHRAMHDAAAAGEAFFALRAAATKRFDMQFTMGG